MQSADIEHAERPSPDTAPRPAGDSPASEAPAKGERRPVEPEAKEPNPADQSEKESEDTKQDDAPSGFKVALRKHPVAMIGCAVIFVAGVIAGVAYYLHARHFETTDDAFIDGRPVLISPQVTGTLVAVNVTDNQVVKAGDLLAKIDPRDYQAALDQADAQIRQAEATAKNLDAQVAAQYAQIEQASKQVAEAQATFNFARDENTRYQELVEKGAGTVQRAQQAASDFNGKKAALDAAIANKTSAERQIDVLKAQKDGALAQLDQIKAQRDQAAANLGRTELRAPVDGRVAKLTAAVGALATSAQSIMVVVPLDVWVTANFKESQLADMQVGQPVTISIDAYSGRTYNGKINSIQAGSGTAFSLLPAENATGNYVKVVQRVPVKITFDQRPDVEIGPGMSVVPTVTVRP